jgi:hypothetical protein
MISYLAGFTKSYLEKHFTLLEMNLFSKFMFGKIVALLDNETIYYYHDVLDFCDDYGIVYPIEVVV